MVCLYVPQVEWAGEGVFIALWFVCGLARKMLSSGMIICVGVLIVEASFRHAASGNP